MCINVRVQWLEDVVWAGAQRTISESIIEKAVHSSISSSFMAFTSWIS